MDKYEKEFESTGQESHRLSIALRRFTEVQDPAWKSRYQRYLSVRFRPALMELIRQGDLFRIRQLCLFAPVTEASLDTFTAEAVRLHKDEILVFLMEYKKQHFGFHDREFTL